MDEEPVSDSLDEPLADTLKLIMQHSSNWDIKDLCRLLQVSSSCRQALRQSRCKCDVFLMFQQLNLRTRCRVQGFTKWLSGHAGLVSSFAWVACVDSEQQQELQLLQRQLAWALQMYRLRAPAATAGATGGVATGTQPLPLQLTAADFGDSWPEPQLVRELAAAGLQELRVYGVRQEPAPLQPSYFTCFETLSSLVRLHIQDPQHSMVHSAGFMSAVQQLSALTSLHLSALPADATQQLPTQLQDLAIGFAAGSSGSTVVSLSHLTALRQLTSAAADGVEGLELLLPPNLTRLDTGGKVSRVTGATALQEAYVEGLKDTDVNVLVHLCSLPVLGSLSIECSSFSTPSASEVATAALGSATALTQLKLWHVDFASGTGVTGLCRQLAKLPRLASLQMGFCSMPEGRKDLLCLTALTPLTSLALDGTEFLDDVVAAALARHLTGLCDLRLVSNSIASLGLLPVVGALTRLSSLFLYGDKLVVGADELMLLSSLTELESLAVNLHCSEEEEQQHFLAGMPHLEWVADADLLIE